MITQHTTRRRPLTCKEMDDALSRASDLLAARGYLDAANALHCAAMFVGCRGAAGSVGSEILDDLVEAATLPGVASKWLCRHAVAVNRRRVRFLEQFHGGRDVAGEV